MTICHFDQVTVSTEMILQLKPSVLKTEPTTQTMKPSSTQDNEAIIKTGHTAEHNVKAASDTINAIQNAQVSFNLV
jgi:hypothetical protein